ncbi:hypothetical protein QJS10_CPB11g00333 [Acorus calamus]|uniref:Uncharacterized protein n=1 Tax=Acorus calamus TaxID=4465 RepID=A0AAV9DRC9_ACOCL|nr:hypothetical protein QJS10_CPB11g00333 [Acorus calamus]
MRRMRNRITSIHTIDGQVLNEMTDIKEHIVNHFTSHWQSKLSMMEQIPQDLFQTKISDQMAEELIAPFTEEELHQTMIMCKGSLHHIRRQLTLSGPMLFRRAEYTVPPFF